MSTIVRPLHAARRHRLETGYPDASMPDRFETDPAVDAALLAAVLLGDGGAARALVSRLAPIIRWAAHRRAPGEAREDLIQEVWAHLWSRNCRALQQWDRRGPLAHYVLVVASNLIRDRLSTAAARARCNEQPIEQTPELPSRDDTSHRLEVEQLLECLERAKSRLSQTHRELIHLRHEAGLKHRQIADKLGKTIGYVGTTLTRAERYLREEVIAVCADHLGAFRSIL